MAVLVEMALRGSDFAPFTADALARYGARAGVEVTASSAQAAIDALRDNGLVWRSARGQYALEEQALAEWIKAREL